MLLTGTRGPSSIPQDNFSPVPQGEIISYYFSIYLIKQGSDLIHRVEGNCFQLVLSPDVSNATFLLRMVPISSDTLKGFWGKSPRVAWALASLCPSEKFPMRGPQESYPAATCNCVSGANSIGFLTRDGPSRNRSQLHLSSHHIENTQLGSAQSGERALFKEPLEDEDRMRHGQASDWGNVGT